MITATLDRPQLTMRQRRKNPDQHSVMLGRAHLGFPVRLPCEEHAVIFAPPRTGKTALLAKLILRYPGPCLSTTTRPDVYRHTVQARQRLGGRIDVFNPQGIGGVPSTFALDVIGGTPENPGCLDIATAIRRANAFAYAVSSQGIEDGAFWASKTSGYLRAFFFAAAYARSKGLPYGLANATRWALTDRSEEAEDILHDAGAGHWSEEVRQLRGQAQKTAETIRMYLSQALQFMADPALAASVTPRPDEAPFDLGGFALGHDSLYMIAQGQDEHSPMAGLFACLASEIHYAAGLAGSFTDSGRLPRPMLFALDEVAQICPVPLHSWMADSGGKGIQLVAVGHGEAQFRAKWGGNGARQIFDCAGCLVILPGVTDPETLRSVSASCGSISMRHHGSENYTPVPVMDEAMIRCLPPGHALLLRNNLSPVIIRAGRVWTDPLYLKLRKEPLPGWPARHVPLAIVPGEVLGPDDSSDAPGGLA
jgi:type IV secretion system protein VirD4